LRRRNRAGLKRIGLLALALVIALGAMGVGYAVWTEDLYINSTVYTGTLDVDITGVSSTFVYKVPGDPPSIYVDYYYENEDTPFTPPAGWTLIAQATTVDKSQWMDGGEVVDTDSAEMAFSGLFPGIDFIADIELEYLGSIPARISFVEVVPVDADDPSRSDDNYDIFTALCAMGVSQTEGIWIDAELSTNAGASWTKLPDPLSVQLQKNDLVHLTVHVFLPEGSDYDNLSLDFTGKITVEQWNTP